MGNETSANLAHFTNEQIRSYQEKYKHLEDTIMTNNEAIRSLLQEKAQLMNTVDELRKELAKKDEDTKRRLHDVRNSRKALDSELNKYKSNPEFEAILNLNRDLIDFKTRLDTVIESNCGMLQMNKDDDEVERIKRRNAELYRDVKNANIALPGIGERSAELRDAEAELNAKKETVRQEFLKVNAKLVQIKEKMGQATAKFAGTVENSIGELRKNLQTYQKEMAAIEQGNSGVNDTLMYEKVKNILLQQQNALMAQIMNSNAGSSTNFNPPIKKVLNNLSSAPNIGKPKNTNVYQHNPFHTSTSEPLFKNTQGTYKEHVNFDASDSDSDNSDTFSIVDDVSETGSVSGRPKTFKLILLNVNEGGNKSDDQKVQMVLRELTKLSLDDIDVRRVGKPTGKDRPIIVAFDSFTYIQELLKNRCSLKNTKFSGIRVCAYKSKPKPTDGKKDFKPHVPRKPRNKNGGPQGKGGNNPKDRGCPF